MFVQRICWDGAHSPRAYWHVIAQLAPGSGFGALRRSLVLQLTNNKFLQRCRSCGYEGLAGHFYDEICHSCCERSGWVF